MPRDIFISYSQPDRECALELTQHLEADGLGVWVAPRDVTPGADWAAEIMQALSAARVMVLVFSAHTNDSPQVRREVERAVHKRLLVVPVRIEDALPSSSLEYFLSAEHWLDAYPPPRQPHYARLCTHLKALSGGGMSAIVPAAQAASATRPAPDFTASPEQTLASARSASARAVCAVVPGPDQSLAVLPFANLSSDPEQEYFSDGLSEELIHQLANLKGLHVAGRTSSFSFKGRQEDLRVIGEKLGVAHVLEGSVRKAANRLRITAQLISCADGYHLWSQTFDRTLEDVFAIQDDIARAVAKALSVALGVGQALMLGSTRNIEAYDLYLRAQAFSRLAGAAELQRASELYRAAIAIDPEFALAWSGLAVAMLFTWIHAPEKSDQARHAQEQALERVVERSLTFAPHLWSSHLASAMYKHRQLQWREALSALQTAVDLAPPSECFPRDYLAAIFAALGRTTEAISALESARSADPLWSVLALMLQMVLTIAGREEDAEAEYRRSQSLEGDREALEEMALFRAFGRGDSLVQEYMRRYVLAAGARMPILYELAGVLNQPDLVRAKLRQAFEDPGYQDPTRQFKLALWSAQFDDVELALAAARLAYVERRSPVVIGLLWTPSYRKVRKDPRFKDLLRDLKIVDCWRETGQWGEFARPVGEGDFEVW